MNGCFLYSCPASGASSLPLCGSSELDCIWSPASVSFVCVVCCVWSVPAHLGMDVLVASLVHSHSLENRPHPPYQVIILAAHSSWVDLFIPCGSLLLRVPAVGLLLDLEIFKAWIIPCLYLWSLAQCLTKRSTSLNIVKKKLYSQTFHGQLTSPKPHTFVQFYFCLFSRVASHSGQWTAVYIWWLTKVKLCPRTTGS